MDDDGTGLVSPRILIAGVGNVLRADDGFGVVVAERLGHVTLPAGVRVVETGIGGIALVQELQEGYDALLVVDAVDRGRPPGTVMVIDAEVVDIDTLSWTERHDLLADMHLATPGRALMLARALGVLPPKVVIVGCQPEDAETFGRPMTDAVTRSVEVGVTEIIRQVQDLCVSSSPRA